MIITSATGYNAVEFADYISESSKDSYNFTIKVE